MYKIKEACEDFIVEEMIDYPLGKSGKFYVFRMMKKGLTTMEAVEKVADELHMQSKDIGYSGLKDKIAITTQYISVFCRKRLNTEYDFGDVSLKLAGFRDERLYAGCLKGNSFQITIRNISEKPSLLPKMINYYGQQRFSQDNVAIGRHLIREEYDEALKKIIGTTSDKSLLAFYQEHKNEPVTVLMKVKPQLLRLFLHSFQSHLWNRCVEIAIDGKQGIEIFPLIGFDTSTEGSAGKIVKDILSAEGINMRNFIQRKLQGFGLEQSMRDMYINVDNLFISELEDDELNQGMKKCMIRFTLPKGCYATEYIRQMMGL